jgi:hypothetical protein
MTERERGGMETEEILPAIFADLRLREKTGVPGRNHGHAEDHENIQRDNSEEDQRRDNPAR